MHCDACSTLITSQFKKVDGVRNVKVDLGAQTAEVFYNDRAPSVPALRARAEKYGYTVSTSRPAPAGQQKIPLWQWAVATLIAAGLVGLFALLQRSGLMSVVGTASAGASYGVALLVGVVASLSTCLAVVGAIVIAFAEIYQAAPGESAASAVVRPNILFHVGRIATFAVLGGFLGLIGGELSLSGRFVSVLTMAVAVFMLLLGLNILGLAPSLTRLGIKMPARLTSGLDRMKTSRSPAMPLALGGLTFFLPCGFTQSMQIMALGSGSFVRGASIMALFAVGTLPVLFTAGVTASWTRQHKVVVFQKAAGLLVIAFALFTLSSGARLFGFTGRVTPGTTVTAPPSTTPPTTIPPVTTPPTTTPTTSQRIEMHVKYSGFEPAVLHVKKGIPVTFVVFGDEVTGCTSRIIIPSLNISQDVKAGENIITFTPTAAGNIPYSCWMGMVHGTIVVDD
jgi:sulfite exporter TauE/SafE/copper chaperone CopZ/plastocyanin